MPYRWRALFGFVLMLYLCPALGSLVSGLYEARVEIADHSQSAQAEAAQQALGEVLVKVSGNRELLGHDQIAANIDKARDHMHAYSFETEDEQLLYRASFDPNAVQRMIRLAGFPIWDARRPDSLIWIAMQSPQTRARALVGESDSTGIADAVAKVAAKRGIHADLPVLDLADIQLVSVYDVWGGFRQNVLAASERYGADYVILARVYQDRAGSGADYIEQPGWKADWTLFYANKVESGSLSAGQPDVLAAQLVEMLADNLAATYAIDTQPQQGDEGRTELTLSNVASLNQYAAVRALLSSLSVVANVSLVMQSADKATFELDLLGDEQDLIKALSLDDRIRQSLDDPGMPGDGLQFVWEP